LKRCVLDIVMEKPAEVSWRGVWFFHDYVKHPSPGLTSAGFSMTMSNTHRLDWLQQVFPWLSNIPIASTDFRRFFHDYVYSHGTTCWSQSRRWVCLK
jgi:hypothetical protein